MKEKKTINVQIGKRIHSIRRKRRYTQEQLAEEIGVTPQYLSDLERGISGASITTIKNICQTLDVPSDLLLFGYVKSSDINEGSLVDKVSRLSEEEQNLVESFINLIHKASDH